MKEGERIDMEADKKVTRRVTQSTNGRVCAALEKNAYDAEEPLPTCAQRFEESRKKARDRVEVQGVNERVSRRVVLQHKRLRGEVEDSGIGAVGAKVVHGRPVGDDIDKAVERWVGVHVCFDSLKQVGLLRFLRREQQ